MINATKYNESIVIICESLIQNMGLSQELEIIYARNPIKYYMIAKSSKHYELPYIIKGTLEREIHIKHILGLVLYAEEDKVFRENIQKKIKKYYREIYHAVETGSENINEIIKEKTHANTDWDVIFSYGIIAYYLIRIKYGFNDIDSKEMECLVNYVEDHFSTLLSYKSPVYNYDEEYNNSDNIQYIKEYEEKFKSLQSCKEFEIFLDYANLDKKPPRILTLIEHKMILFLKHIHCMADIQGIDCNQITKNQFLSKEERRRILRSIIATYSEEDYYKRLSEETVAYFYVAGMYIQSIMKEYKRTKEFYRQDNKENQYLEIERLQRENNTLRDENKKLEVRIHQSETNLEKLDKSVVRVRSEKENKLFNKIKLLEDEIERLKNELEDEKGYHNELNDLREFVLSSNYKDDEIDEVEKDIKYPNDKRIVLIGGQDNWQNKIREEFPFITIIDGFNQNSNLDILENADLVLLHPKQMSHAIYYKVISISKKRVPLKYVNITNLKQFKKQLYSILEL